MSETGTIAVAGAGLMGQGIAVTFALAGHDVRFYDTPERIGASAQAIRERLASAEAVRGGDGESGRVTAAESLRELVDGVDLVVEAVPA